MDRKSNAASEDVAGLIAWVRVRAGRGSGSGRRDWDVRGRFRPRRQPAGDGSWKPRPAKRPHAPCGSRLPGDGARFGSIVGRTQSLALIANAITSGVVIARQRGVHAVAEELSMFLELRAPPPQLI